MTWEVGQRWIRRAAIWVLGKLEQGRIIFVTFVAAKSRRGVCALLMDIGALHTPRLIGTFAFAVQRRVPFP